MEWLNYHHLLYFWVVAREGSIAAACPRLHLSQPTISMQIRALERSLGHKLFDRSGRNLVLTDMGRVVQRYADDIFSTGQELLDTLKDRPTGAPLRLHVGIAEVLPKLIAFRLLAPAFQMSDRVCVICAEGKPIDLITRLSVHDLDLVLSDTPIAPHIRVRGFSHLLGRCGVTFFAVPKLAAKIKKGFPRSLNGAPLVLPTETTNLRRDLDNWFDAHELHPQIVAESEDSALLKVFGQAGLGAFPGPAAIEKEIVQQYGVVAVGRVPSVKESFYAISAERKFKHPAVVAIADTARKELFD